MSLSLTETTAEIGKRLCDFNNLEILSTDFSLDV